MRLRYNSQRGQISAAAMTNSQTGITVAVAPNFATIVAPDYIPLTLDPNTATMEIAYLTAYTSGATTGTITRGAEDATLHPAAAHGVSATWDHGPTVQDFRPWSNAATAGALPTITFTSGTGAQVSTTKDVFLTVPVTLTTAAGTCKVEISPDNTTYSTLVTLAPGVNASVTAVTLLVPAAWYVRLTVTNATLAAGTYY